MSSEPGLPYPLGTLRQMHDRGEFWVTDDAGRIHELCPTCQNWYPDDLLPAHRDTHTEQNHHDHQDLA